MNYQATAKYIRQSPRKVRLVADSVRELTPSEALTLLSRTSKRAAKPVAAVISSAIANAKQKNADVSQLTFKAIEVTEGPVMKRWRPVSRGRAHGYKKRMSHVRIVLGEPKKQALPAEKEEKKKVASKDTKEKK